MHRLLPSDSGDSHRPLCVSHKMEGRKNQPLPTSFSPLWGFGSSMPWARGEPNGCGEGRCGQRAGGQGWKVRVPGRPPGSEELGWRVTGPGNQSSPGAHGLAGEAELQPFMPWMMGLWLRGLLHPSLGDGEPAWLPAHSPGQWEPWAHPSLCRISGASVLTSTSAEASSLSASHGRLLPASVPVPRQACFPTSTPDPCAWPCMCVRISAHVMCVHVCTHVRVCIRIHIYIHVHVCTCICVCACASVCACMSLCAYTPTFTYMSMCVRVHMYLCMCMCPCARACPCVHMNPCLHTCPCVRVRSSMYACVSTCVHVSVRVHVCGHACLCMCYTSQGGLWGALLLKVLISTFCSITPPTTRGSRK